jgi:predicted nucleic acid-binding protein
MAEAVFKALLDTSVYIPYINQGINHPVLESVEKAPVIYMSAVVMEELYAGALDGSTKRLLDRIFTSFRKLGRMVSPDASEWQRAGKIVATLSRKYGFEQIFLARLVNDILIALCARRVGAMLFTRNRKDYLRIREYIDFKIAPNG